jgi:uncharacterized membrane protein
MRSLLLFVHLIAVAVWVGGMFFVHFCLRPAAAEVLAPPQRLPLIVSALGRFFRWVAVAIGLLWISGLARMLEVGFADAPLAWHVMMTLGLVMTVLFGVIAHVVFPKVKALAVDGQFPEAAQRLVVVRHLVAVNLTLGVLTIAVAAFGV